MRAGAPGAIHAVVEGRAAVQDEGSQLVALALATAEVVGEDDRWLDLCAGPGGKAGLLAALVAQRGGALTAVEIQPHRADLIRRTLRGVPGSHRVVVADGTTFSGTFDRVLVDAPCTGLGVLRRRPESRWRREPGDVAALAPLQRSLLRNAIACTRPGGVIAYATCSPHLAETDLVVEDVLRDGTVDRLDAREITLAVPGLHDVEGFRAHTDPGPALRLWPHRHDTDGMYLSLLRRRA